MDGREDAREPVDVHRLVEAVADRLLDERVIRDFAIARDVLEAGGRVGERRGEQIVGLHALHLRRHAAAAAAARDGQRDGGVPAPARLEHGRVEQRLHEDRAHAVRMEVPEHVGERKRVLRAERQEQRVVGGGRLQLEVELAAEALAEREAPGAIDAAAQRGVQDELHAARLVEEALDDQRPLGRQRAEEPPRLAEIVDDLERRGARRARRLDQPVESGLRLVEPRVELPPQLADRV